MPEDIAPCCQETQVHVEALEKVRARQAALRTRSPKPFRQSLRILRGNPTARSTGRLAEALESLRKLGDGDRD